MTPLSPEQLRVCLAAVAEHGGIRPAARALGVPFTTLQNRLNTAKLRARVGLDGGPPIPEVATPAAGFRVTRNGGEYDAQGKLVRQWVGTKPDAGEAYAAPEGHTVKGESALLDPDGRVLVRWVKTREGGGAGLVDALKAAFADHAGMAPLCAPPAAVEDETLTVYPLPDLHLGMQAWGRETGADYDTAIAVDSAASVIARLVGQSRPSRHAVLLVLGDYFHANDSKDVTPGSGHKLDVSGRWPQVFAAGARLALRLVDIVAAKHESVEVVFLPGNHDVDSAMALTVALDLYYSRHPRITVNTSPGIAWYRRFGAVLLGATHGHTMKPAQMAMMMAADRAADWGETRHRAMFFGHIHHESVIEVGPVRVESFNSPASRDAWNAAGGYRSGRSLTAITFGARDGEIGRHKVNITGTAT